MSTALSHSHSLSAVLANAPDASLALVFGDRQWTYAELRAQVASVAQGLHQQGLEAGDVLGIWLPNTPRWLVLHLACASLGVATLSLNLKLGVQEIVNFIDRSGCKALAFDRHVVHAGAAHSPDEESSLERVLRLQQGSLRWVIDATQDALDISAIGVNLQADADSRGLLRGDVDELPCIILSSSGTTSQPKLIVHTQRNVALHVQDVAPGFFVDGHCRTLLAIPMCGAFGYTAALMTLAAGATLVLQEVFEPIQAAQWLRDTPVTHMFGTNDMVEKLIAPLPADWRPKALRMFGHANFVPGLDELPARAEGLGIHMVGCFGMSEIFALFAHQNIHADLARRSQSGGIPVSASAQVRARLLETGELADAMVPGELEIRGPFMMKEYLGNPEATAKAFTDDGFLRTGDLGYVNGEGGFTHISRLGDVLRIGGFLVNPAEIEDAVLSACGASACQVVAVNFSGGSRPVAFVIASTADAIDETSIKERLMRQIAKYKVPIRIFVVESFPYTMGPNGMKVKRNELRDMAQALLDQEGLA